MVVAFTGISGVGKTTFLQSMAGEIAFQHLTGGSLIAVASAAPDRHRDELRLADLDENQRLLIRGFYETRDPAASIIIIDGHVIIDGPTGTTEIGSLVFASLGVNLMVHLEAEPTKIARNRARDTSRDRPARSVDVLRRHQEKSRQRARVVADELGIEFLAITHSRAANLVERIGRLSCHSAVVNNSFD